MGVELHSRNPDSCVYRFFQPQVSQVIREVDYQLASGYYLLSCAELVGQGLEDAR